MNSEQELRNYVGEHLGEHHVDVRIYTSMVDGYPRLYEFTVSFNGYNKIQESIKASEWTEQREKELVREIKAEIDEVAIRKEREDLNKSILKRVAEVFNNHGFNAEATYDGVAVFQDHEKHILSGGAEVIFKITTNEDNSKLIMQYKDYNPKTSGFRNVNPNDCFVLDLSDPGSLDDGLISFVKKISIGEVDRRLKIKRKEVDQLKKWKAGLEDEDIFESVKQIMPGFRKG